jgi:hypothetical protein
MYEESGAFIFGRRTYDITNGWGGAHPVNGVPVFVLTHTPPPAEIVPKRPSKLTIVTDGIASAIRQAIDSFTGTRRVVSRANDFPDQHLLRTWNVKYLHTLEEPTVESLLTQLADELLVQDITDRSAVLAVLSDDDLQAAYDHVLEQFALELLIGAHENSEWSDAKLVIDANHGPIHLLQTAFYAVKLEVQRRFWLVMMQRAIELLIVTEGRVSS